MPDHLTKLSTNAFLHSGIGNLSRFLKFNTHELTDTDANFHHGTPRPEQFQCLASLGISVFSTPVPPKDLIADQAEPGARRKYMEKLPENVLNDVSHLDTDWKGTRGFRT